MSFLETLKAVGGVKPCSKCCDADGSAKYPCGVGKYIDHKNQDVVCPACHGTGQILDLAPLLAKPKALRDVVECLIHRQVPGGNDVDTFAVRLFDEKNLYVIGPQRAHSLVYEIAR